MNTDTLVQAGLSELQAKIYIYLIKNGLSRPSEIAKAIKENRTTVYSAAEKLAAMEIVTKKNRGKVAAYLPNHPSSLENMAEKRLRRAARQAKNVETNLPFLINFYNDHQSKPGVITYFGVDGIKKIWNKVIETKATYYFIRSHHDSLAAKDALEEFKQARVKAGIEAEDITPSEFTNNTRKVTQSWLLKNRTLLPPGEYDSPVEIDIFGDYVAFINYEHNGMSTLIESPEIADSMRQFFLFSRKHIRKSTDQNELYNQTTSKEKE